MKKVIALILVLVAMLCLSACSNNKGSSNKPEPVTNPQSTNSASNSSSAKNSTVNLNDYIFMDTKFQDKNGWVDCRLNLEALIQDNCDAKAVEKLSKTFNKEYDSVDYAAYRIAYEEYKKITPSFTSDVEDGHFSNGDVIHVSWKNIDTDFCEKLQSCLGVKFTYSDFDLTVSGLESIKTYDVFSNIELQSSDISGSGRYPLCIAKVPMPMYQNGVMVEGTYEVYLNPVSRDRDGQLANGDTVRYMIDEESIQLMETNCGCVPEQTEGDIVLNCFQ